MSSPPQPGDAPVDAALAALEPGFLVGNGRFTLGRLVGRGGMGVVWLARDEALREDVALKFLPTEIRFDAVALDDLRRETARARKLTHPNIIRIHDLYKDEREAFISMEYVDGPNLSDLRLAQAARVFTWSFLEPLVKQLCEALDYAHCEKVVHRDLKPANMMLDSRGRLKLSDFGIAAQVSDSVSRVSMIRHGQSGTVTYMSPQQMDGKLPQVTDDIYALGATLYELLTSKPPFFTGDIAHQARNMLPQPMDERLAELEIKNDVPRSVAALIMACLGKIPEQRPASARAVAEWIGFQATASVEPPSAVLPRPVAAPVTHEPETANREATAWRAEPQPQPSPPSKKTAVKPPQIPQPVFLSPGKEGADEPVTTAPATFANSRSRTVWFLAGFAIVLVVTGLITGGLAWWWFSRSAKENEKVSAATGVADASSAFLKTEHVLTGHNGAISSVTFSPDQKFLISGSADGTVRIYETSRGELKWTTNAEVGAISAVAVSRENKLLAAAGGSGQVRLFDLASGRTVETLRSHTVPVTAAAFSPENTDLASADESGAVAIWDYGKGAAGKGWSAHNSAVRSLAFSRRGGWLATGGQDQSVRIWNVLDGTLIKSLGGHKGIVWSLAFSADGKLLVSSSRDRSARIWDTSSLATKRTIQWGSDANLMHGVAISPDSKFIATGSNSSVKVFKVETARRGTDRSLKGSGMMRPVAFSPDGRAIVAGSDNGLLHIWPFRGEAMFGGVTPPETAEMDAPEPTNMMVHAATTLPPERVAKASLVTPAAGVVSTVFDGQTLNGWHGEREAWSVSNGTIVGRYATSTAGIRRPTGLFLNGPPMRDFELEIEFRNLVGAVDVRFHTTENADLFPSGYACVLWANMASFSLARADGVTGGLSYPGTALTSEATAARASALKKNDWNQLRIVVQENRFRSEINGVPFLAPWDGQNFFPAGGLALTLHPGAAAEFRNIRLRRLAP